MTKGVEELKTAVKKSIKMGHDEDAMNNFFSNSGSFKDIGEYIISEVISDVIDEYPNYGFIQKIVRSKIVCDGQGDNQKIMLLDEENRSIEEYDRTRIKEVLDPKFDMSSKLYTAKYEYIPLKPGMLIKNDDGTFTYNTYEPPFWQENWFYSNGKDDVRKELKIPYMYVKFLKHLVGDEENSDKSFDYILKWLANGLRRKNYCILTTIGKQGIGKGVLGSIMKVIFGKNNYYEGQDRMFKGTFNAQIADRRLVYCDEITIKAREDEDRLKVVVNDNIEIEQKGMDAKNIKNYASFYISSNNMDAIQLTADDRRFSIVQLTETKLLDSMTPKEIDSLLYPRNVEKLVRYLWHLKVDEAEMAKVFITKRTGEVRAMGLKEWEEWFVFDFCDSNKGKIIQLKEVQEELKENFGYNSAAGRGKFMNLYNKYPQIFKLVLRKVKNENSPKWCVEVSDEI